MTRIVAKLDCPRCGSTVFLAGPRGGAAQNIKCAKCGYRLTVTRLPGGGYWITEEDGIEAE